MYYLNKIENGIDFIEDHLDVDIELSDVAKAAALSQWHFQRIFKALTNETLKSYIRSRRLSNALEALLESDEKIINIALTAGFDSQESFTRAFKKTFNITPSVARNLKNKKTLLGKVKIDVDYLKHINNNISLSPDIRNVPKKLLVGVKTTFYDASSNKNNIAETLPALWQQFEPLISTIEHRVLDYAYGLIKPANEHSELLEYYAVCEVTQLGAIPKGMVTLSIPPTRYAVFRHNGDGTNIDNTVNYIYSNWLMQANAHHSGGADLEIYGKDFKPNSDQSVMHYAIPIVD